MGTPTPMLLAAVILAMPLSAALAQGPIPTGVRAKMNGYVGTWDYEERVRETPTAPETVTAGTWEARWIYDSLIQWTGTGIGGDGRSISSVEYEGYDPVMQGYSYWFASDGSRGQAYDGEWDGNTIRIQLLVFSPEREVSRGRCTWPYNDDFSAVLDYHCEQLTAGTWWVSRRGTATKVGG